MWKTLAQYRYFYYFFSASDTERRRLVGLPLDQFGKVTHVAATPGRLLKASLISEAR